MVLLVAVGFGVGFLVMPTKERVVVSTTTETETQTETVRETLLLEDAAENLCDEYARIGQPVQRMRLCVQAVNLDRYFKASRLACDDPALADALGVTEDELSGYCP